MKTLIILPISRSEHLDKVFTRLEMLKCDRTNTDLLISIHGDKALITKATEFSRGSNFANKIIVEYKTKRSIRSNSTVHRRKDISNIHNLIRSSIHSQYDYIFGLEDDTLFADDTLKKLTALASTKPNAGIISGVEVGRWGIPYIGAWKADDVYEPSCLTTVHPYQASGLTEVDATGLYCFIVKADYYLKHTFKPYQDILGPDVDFGLALRQEGLQNYIDWSIRCGHINKAGDVLYPTKDIRAVEYKKGKKAWHYKSF